MYETCIELAGAKVIVFKEFGSYQGDWWGKVEYKGNTGWVNGSYGSCSVCDAFQAEFGYDGHYEYEESYNEYHDYFDLKDGCEKCEELKKRMVEFGKQYLDNIMSQEEAEEKASENLDWDMDAQEMLNFIRENAIYKN